MKIECSENEWSELVKALSHENKDNQQSPALVENSKPVIDAPTIAPEHPLLAKLRKCSASVPNNTGTAIWGDKPEDNVLWDDIHALRN